MSHIYAIYELYLWRNIGTNHEEEIGGKWEKLLPDVK
jgi:hypothetical protein